MTVGGEFTGGESSWWRGCTAHNYEVYGIIQDMIKKGRAKFVNDSGRYWVDWDRALEFYEAYRRKKNPYINLSRRQLSNDLRSALLSSSYKKDGAKEYHESKKRNNDDEVVERQFQMPHKVFKSLFGNAECSDISEEQDEQGTDKAQVPLGSSSDTGFDDGTLNVTYGPSEQVDLGTLDDPANVPGTSNQGGSSDIQMISAKPKEIPTEVEENTQTPTTKGIGNSGGVGGSKAFEIPVG
ncbi:PREDICTED: uncharacterized protein LOC107358408 [Acropora digitifera]|uniref:uncharacterized protein LOC107358408 n=1 Tax=Acropora digitifera TaxID=70779 RepID=UPI00077AE0E8|nr:PREDICTED: uncharacterized protein LOC107358408 [Acropora digitifera]